MASDSIAIRNCYALILAGGRGTRLGALTDRCAKPAIPFGGSHRIIDFPLSNCLNSGVGRIGIATQYKAESLLGHVARNWTMRDTCRDRTLELLHAHERSYGGTADAAFQNLDTIRSHDPDTVLILAGDHVYRMDYARMLADHLANGADLTVACMEVPIDEARAFGVMGVDKSGRIARFVEKPAMPDALPDDPRRALASMGIYVFNARFLYRELARDARVDVSSHDFGKDIIPHLVGRARVFAHCFQASAVGPVYWRDVGTVASYWAASMGLLGADPQFDLFDEGWPILGERAAHRPARCLGGALLSDTLLGPRSVVHAARVERSVVSADAHIGEDSHIEECVMLPGAQVGKAVRLRRAIVDEGCIVPDGFSISTADGPFHVERGITLLTADMIRAVLPCRKAA